MRATSLIAPLVLFTLCSALLHCSSSPTVCFDTDCPALPDASATDGSTSDGSTADGGTDSDGGDGGTVAPPADCDATKEPKDAPACVVDGFGVFVDGNAGSDANAGTKTAPVRTIGAALGKLSGKPRIYVCAGTYTENVVLTSAVSIYGGFACTTWSYAGSKANITPTTKGYGLKLTAATSPVTFADLAIEVQSGTDAGESSIAVFVANSTATFTRVSMTAHDGIAGADMQQKAQLANASKGGPPANPNGGAGAKQTCAEGDSSGGNGGTVGANDATPGTPSLGSGQAGTVATDCAAGGSGVAGHTGSTGDSASLSIAVGSVAASGWTGTKGADGKSGGRGQGGGGGGSRTGAGGGGGAGGCGGAGGGGGGAGGSSIALLSFQSTVTLNSSTLATHTGGRGGAGAQGQIGQPPGGGGAGGIANPFDGCAGGQGGTGGNGGGGAGGAGGVSVPVVYSGTQPTQDGATMLTPGTPGPGGNGTAANDGAAGKNDPMLGL